VWSTHGRYSDAHSQDACLGDHSRDARCSLKGVGSDEPVDARPLEAVGLDAPVDEPPLEVVEPDAPPLADARQPEGVEPDEPEDADE